MTAAAGAGPGDSEVCRGPKNRLGQGRISAGIRTTVRSTTESIVIYA